MPESRNVSLISPYGEKLIDLIIQKDSLDEFRARANQLPSLQLSERSICDLELLATGAFSPLDQFMGQEDYQRVLDELRLANGYIFPIPVMLPIDPSSTIHLDQDIALRNSQNEILAIMTITEIYSWDKVEAAQRVFGTTDSRHPLIVEMHRWGKLNISGPLQVLQLPHHYDFQELRLTPAETRERLESMGNSNVVAFQTRNPMHRAHEEITKRATREVEGVLLLHPVVGLTKPGDLDHFTRVRTYKAMINYHYQPDLVLLCLLPLAMRMAGPREALWHALIRRNYGANYLIIGRDHASPGIDSTGKPLYGPYEAQELVERFIPELQVKPIAFHELVYLPDEERYEEVNQVSGQVRIASISGTQVRNEYLNEGKLLPAWFTRPVVAEILAETYPPRFRQGFCIWFTGLSCSGKSTTAEVMTALLLEQGRRVTLLDGDMVRTHLSKGLGFNREDRDTNIRRIGYVAAEIVRHGGAVICAAISPYRATRDEVRSMLGSDQFVEVFVDTPLEVCEARDTKGLYAKARRGELRGFTGVDDPYESPLHPEIILNILTNKPKENAHLILNYLIHKRFIRPIAD